MPHYLIINILGVPHSARLQNSQMGILASGEILAALRMTVFRFSA